MPFSLRIQTNIQRSPAATSHYAPQEYSDKSFHACYIKRRFDDEGKQNNASCVVMRWVPANKGKQPLILGSQNRMVVSNLTFSQTKRNRRAKNPALWGGRVRYFSNRSISHQEKVSEEVVEASTGSCDAQRARLLHRGRSELAVSVRAALNVILRWVLVLRGWSVDVA